MALASPRQARKSLGWTTRAEMRVAEGPTPCSRPEVGWSAYAGLVSDEEFRGYPEPPAVGSEAATLVGSLERQRATFKWKCADLDVRGLSTRLPTSDLSLGRLLKHLAYMEDLNFTRDLGGADLPEPWAALDPSIRSDWVFSSADDDSPETLYRSWDQAVDRSRAAVQSALSQSDDLGSTYEFGDLHVATVRRLLVDMIEEYGRHTGQADLLREAVDGRVGEDPPGPAISFEVYGSDRPTSATPATFTDYR